MKIRRKNLPVYSVTQYNKRGDHELEHVCSVAIPILDELDGEENRFPQTGRLGTLDECKPKDLRYSVSAIDMTDKVYEDGYPIPGKDYFSLNLGDWILELDGRVVGVISPERLEKDFEQVD